jgi:hypothetical protein
MGVRDAPYDCPTYMPCPSGHDLSSPTRSPFTAELRSYVASNSDADMSRECTMLELCSWASSLHICCGRCTAFLMKSQSGCFRPEGRHALRVPWRRQGSGGRSSNFEAALVALCITHPPHPLCSSTLQVPSVGWQAGIQGSSCSPKNLVVFSVGCCVFSSHTLSF